MSLVAAADLVQVPEGAIPEYGITLVSYIDVDGEPLFGYATHGDSSSGAMVGLMFMVAHDLMHTANEYDD